MMRACLDDHAIAALADPRGIAADPQTIAHLADCAACSRRIAALTQQLRERPVTTELRRLHRTRAALIGGAGAGLLAAAAAVVFLLSPEAARRTEKPAAGQHRERAITTTAAPRLVGPTASEPDSLRWTAVPHADRYEVSVFDAEGSVVWEAVTPDTVLAMPAQLVPGPATTYLWRVRARTSWDRWVVSEWAELTLDGIDRSR